MLSYQHSYHAGNFADTHKHAILSLLLEYLKEKPKPFCYIDTHAGRGLYDLQCSEAQKTDEAKYGIWKLDAHHYPVQIEPYFAAIRACNPKGGRRFYPGSPKLAQLALRPEDRLVLIEKHPQEIKALSENFGGESRAAVHNRDAYEGLFALTPPKEKRGLVMIDPSYEVKTEYTSLADDLKKAWERWPTGMYAIWYPVLPSGHHSRLLRRLRNCGIPKILVNEINLSEPVEEGGMCGSGMIIVNPPWRLHEEMVPTTRWLLDALSDDPARSHSTWWLATEKTGL